MVRYYVDFKYPDGDIFMYIDKDLYFYHRYHNIWTRVDTELFKKRIVPLNFETYPQHKINSELRKYMFYKEVIDD
jgi:hypothetical protein